MVTTCLLLFHHGGFYFKSAGMMIRGELFHEPLWQEGKRTVTSWMTLWEIYYINVKAASDVVKCVKRIQGIRKMRRWMRSQNFSSTARNTRT